MSKGGDSYLGNGKEWKKCLFLHLYARVFGDRIWNNCQQRLPTHRSLLLLAELNWVLVTHRKPSPCKVLSSIGSEMVAVMFSSMSFLSHDYCKQGNQ